ncbi:hypothetical protein [uncultured Algibacter sp.]|uniref:hypothetical protein n=1 Tax=uncultured Algibacter sp. TaxID=298659 RepID=UPI00260BF1FB|nr:hypothetical protein [uncultured Algibacter sp.]
MSTLFLVLLVAPTVIILIDDSADISVFYTSSEEEEKKGQEKQEKDKELLYYEFLKGNSYFTVNEAEINLTHYFKNYTRPYLNLISPPPEFSIS